MLSQDIEVSKKYNIPLSHFDFKYVNNCSDKKELNRILKVLRSKEEGIFIELEKAVEKRLEIIDPESPLLRKDVPPKCFDELMKEEVDEVDNALNDFLTSFDDKSEVEMIKKNKPDFFETNIYPIRTENAIAQDCQQINNSNKRNVKKGRALPRSYAEWDKIIKEINPDGAENENGKEEEKKEQNQQDNKPEDNYDEDFDSTILIRSQHLSLNDKKRFAKHEKIKGNESYKSGEFRDAVMFYTRSLSYDENPTVYNNRAAAYLKLKRYARVIEDCSRVLEKEPQNIKALSRRSEAAKFDYQIELCRRDLETILTIEPDNKRTLVQLYNRISYITYD